MFKLYDYVTLSPLGIEIYGDHKGFPTHVIGIRVVNETDTLDGYGYSIEGYIPIRKHIKIYCTLIGVDGEFLGEFLQKVEPQQKLE